MHHHLIDPRTGRSSNSDVVAATVIAATVARAETLAKAAVLLPSSEAVSSLNQQSDVAAILALDDRGLRFCGDRFQEVLDVRAA